MGSEKGSARAITEALGGKWHGAYGQVCCPAHDDSNPSLSITTGDEVDIVLKCWAGCEQEDVLDVLRERDLRPVTDDVVTIRETQPPSSREKGDPAEDGFHKITPVHGCAAMSAFRPFSSALPPGPDVRFGLPHFRG